MALPAGSAFFIHAIHAGFHMAIHNAFTPAQSYPRQALDKLGTTWRIVCGSILDNFA